MGERLQEMVRLLKVEDLGFGLASLTLRREPPGKRLFVKALLRLYYACIKALLWLY